MEDGTPAQPWTIRSDHLPGDLGFDPLGLAPTDPAEFSLMQERELSHGRREGREGGGRDRPPGEKSTGEGQAAGTCADRSDGGNGGAAARAVRCTVREDDAATPTTRGVVAGSLFWTA